jgi:hypothetical protein
MYQIIQNKGLNGKKRALEPSICGQNRSNKRLTEKKRPGFLPGLLVSSSSILLSGMKLLGTFPFGRKLLAGSRL